MNTKKPKSDPWATSQYMCPIINPHDIGGDENFQDIKLDLHDRSYEYWERSVHALMVCLVRKGLLTVDEMRRGIEVLPPETYASWGYYEKWATSIAHILIERNNVTQSEWDKALGFVQNAPLGPPKFKVGDSVKVLLTSHQPLIRKPHLRTPGYIHGCEGVIERYCGSFGDPAILAYRGYKQEQHLYRVRFAAIDIWKGTGDSINKMSSNDTLDVEIYESWLDYPKDNKTRSAISKYLDVECQHHGHSHGHNGSCSADTLASNPTPLTENPKLHSHSDHDHNHSHDHIHEDRAIVEQQAVNKENEDTLGKYIAEELVKQCILKGFVTAEELTLAIQRVDNMGKNAEGPRIVARAWIDSAFKQRLLTNANAALQELGIAGSNSTAATQLTAVENTATVHNVIVCTLCSCYPLSILGLSPPWYKSRAYRARMVRNPRAVLAEFGTVIGSEVSLRVHDSTADLRYIVIPERPAGTEDWTELQLQALVTRDSMIGVSRALSIA